MVSPATIEDTERDELITNRLNQASDILNMIEGKTDDRGIFETVCWILDNFLNMNDITEILKKHKVMSDKDAGFDVTSESDDFDMGNDFGGGPSLGGSDMDFDMGPEPEMGGAEEEPSMTPEA